MADRETVLITGASRGLGLASAARLYRRGFTVVAAMRTPDAAMPRLRELSGASEDDPRLVAVRLDLDDRRSIEEAVEATLSAVGTPCAVVHNAGVAGVGAVEEMPAEVYDQIFATNFFGPVVLTKALLPHLREAGRGRIVVVSSQGGVHGMPGISAYSAAKAALERWAESLAPEVAPFGIGVTVLVAGTFRTDILELTTTYGDHEGPYAAMHEPLEAMEPVVQRFAAEPERFASGLARALQDRAPFRRRAVGVDAHAVLLADRLLPGRVFQSLVTRALRLPKPNSLIEDPARHATVEPPRAQL